MAALAPAAARLGVDLERVEPRPPSFLEDWYTEGERSFVAAAGDGRAALAATLVWSAKEAAMKALREGLRVPPKEVEVEAEAGPADGAWRALGARGPGPETWRGFWRAADGFVLVVVADPPSGPPETIG